MADDYHGSPVEDLTIQDFEVTDNSKPQTIIQFSVDTLNRNAVTGANHSISNAAQHCHEPSRPSNSTMPISVTVLLLGLYNTNLTDQMHGRKQITKFLRQIRPGIAQQSISYGAMSRFQRGA